MDRDSIAYRMRRRGQVAAHYLLPDEFMARFYSRIVMRKVVDLKNPQTFNEKIQWCKLHYFPNEPLVVKCADKYAVREYVVKKGLSEILVPTYGAWSSPEQINWDALPNRFVLKCSHGCAYNILCSDKSLFDHNKASRQLAKWLKEDFGAYNIELHYSKINPRMIVSEEYLGASITDFKFFCFNGEPKYIYVSYDLIHDRQAQIGFFYIDGSPMDFKRDDYAHLSCSDMPPYFEEMKKDAQILCADFPFVRVDYFALEDRYYFAELTFTPSAGMMPFNPPEYDLEWGEELDISMLLSKK